MSGPFGGPPPGGPGQPPGNYPQPPGSYPQPPGSYPQPPGYYPQQAPGGYYQQQGPGYPSYGQPQPAPSRTGAGPIVAVFVGVLVTLALIAGVFIFLNQAPPPVPPCPPAQPCAPNPSLPPVASSPGPPASFAPAGPTSAPGATLPPAQTPDGNSSPVIAGTLFTDTSLGYGFEYDKDVFTLADQGNGKAILNGTFFDAQVWIEAKTADTSPSKLIQEELALVDRFVIARVADTDTYDALLGPSIGYVPGEGSVWSGTLVSRDGTPLAPAGVTIIAASNGQITVAIVVVVGTPDSTQGGETQQHSVRSAADEILKTFKWSAQ